MRRTAVLVLLLAVVGAGCGPDGSQVGLEAIGPATPDSPQSTETVPTAERESMADLCAVWIEGAEINEVYMRARWSSDLESDVLDSWMLPLYTAVLGELVAVLPAGYGPLGTYFTALIEALADDPTSTPAELEAQLIDQTGLELDELEELSDRLFTELEETCGEVEEIERVEIRDADELPEHVRRVAREVQVERLEPCLTTASSLETIADVLDREVLYGQRGEADRADGPARLAALAEECGANPPEAAMFAWRVADVDWTWAMVPDDLKAPVERPPIIVRPPAAPPLEPVVPEPEPIDPEPEVYEYPVEGLVADVLGTLGVVGEPAACLVEAGVYEPSQLWLDEPGVDPTVLEAQRAMLDDVAIACSFVQADVDGWLELAHQYVAEVAAGS